MPRTTTPRCTGNACPIRWKPVSSRFHRLPASTGRPWNWMPAHVHCTREVLGYTLTTPDGQIGKVEDLLIDEQTWAVQQLVVDTARWRPGGEIAVPVALTRGIDREHDAVYVSADKETLQRWPAYH